MIKATGHHNGRKTLFIGLSFGNLDKFKAGPMDTFILIAREEVGTDFDVLIFSGTTEEEMSGLLLSGLAPDATVRMSERKKN